MSVESVIHSHRNGPLIAAAAQVWFPRVGTVLDVTYGKGGFWTDIYADQWPMLTLEGHDLYLLDGVDFRQLPEADASVDVVVLDPPYIAQGGRETSTVQTFLNTYGLVDAPKTASGVDALIGQGMAEAKRVLKPKGVLLVKCMDYVTAGNYHQGRHKVVGMAEDLGLRQVDEFVHYSGTGPQPKHRRQVHSRRAHTFLCVFQKRAR